MRQVFSGGSHHAAFSTKTRGKLGFSKRVAFDMAQCILDVKGTYIIWWGKIAKINNYRGVYPAMNQQVFWEDV